MRSGNKLKSIDTAIVFRTLNELEKKGSSAGPYFQVRIKHLRATMLWEIRENGGKGFHNTTDEICTAASVCNK